MNYGKKGVEKRRKRMASRKQKRLHKLSLSILHIVLLAAAGLMIAGLFLGIGAFKGIIDTAPDISNIDVTPTGFSTFVYDIEGNETAKLVSTDSNRIPVTSDMVPEDLKNAFVAIEDERFYDHHGIDIQGILRAAFRGITTGDFSEGASTITQQLLKNNVFTGWTNETFLESVRRKIQEQYLAVELEKRMSKDDILLNYLNTINLGHNTLGVQAASLRYFGKSVSDLTLSECAVIAAITQNPTKYDPIMNPEDNARRRQVVLDYMLRLEMINQEEYDEALADDVYSRIQIVDNETEDEEVTSYFVDALTEQVLDDLMEAGYTETQAYTLLYSGGLSIYSTQDPEIQAIADEVCSDPDSYPEGTKYYLNYRLTTKDANGEVTNYSTEMLESYFKESNAAFSLDFDSEEEANAAVEAYKEAVMEDGDEIVAESVSLTPQPQISLTIEDQSTGHVVAMVGGRGTKTANRTLNRSTDTVRQPGSTFKVLAVYAPALDAAGLTLATVQDDAPYTYPNGTPVRNWYGESYRGLSSLRVGIQNSMNIVAVKTLVQITPQLGYDYLQNFGFTTLVDNEVINGQTYSDVQPTLALGGITKGVTNMEMNAAYATIANGGMYIEPKLYTKVVDHDGNVILDNTEGESHRVLKETTAWLLTSAMEDVVTKGTGTSVNFGTTAIAGKTGTTDDYNDVWFSGYTDYYTATAWAGFDDNTKLSSSQEKALARSIWRAVMERIHEDLPYADFERPSGIVTATVCSKSGKLPVAGLCDAYLTTEYFAQETVPTEQCDVHYQGLICEYSGLPASDECPFKVEGVVELESGQYGQKCPHDAEFFAQADAQTQLAQQQAELEVRRATANAAASLEQTTAALQAATEALASAQATLTAAQQGGDQAAITSAQSAVNTALANYSAALAAQQQAQAASAAGSGSGTSGTATGTGGTSGTTTGQ
ncbi:MAG: PBP1A family penicillin-binding protein [Eubacteriales bacterium]|nr:PBP1A family penicillin-binding protein [Eubacteriales bacterium]